MNAPCVEVLRVQKSTGSNDIKQGYYAIEEEEYLLSLLPIAAVLRRFTRHIRTAGMYSA